MLTIKQIADSLDISKTTARRYLQQIGAEPTESRAVIGGVSRTVKVYPDEVLAQLQAARGEGAGGALQGAEQVRSMCGSQCATGALQLAPLADSSWSALQEQIDHLQRENEDLRAQLRRQDETLADARADKVRLYEALSRSQQLQALEERRAAELEDKSRASDPAPERRGWMHFFRQWHK